MVFKRVDGALQSLLRRNGGRERNVAVLIFDAVELIDVSGPFQVFHASRDEEHHDKRLFNVYAVAERANAISTEAGVTLVPRYTIQNCPKPDVLIIPGGIGTRTAAFNRHVMHWISHVAREAELVVSISMGALLLGKAGLLHGLAATTHHQYFDLLKQVARNVTIKPGERFVDSGKIVTSGGVSASIDVSLYVVAKLHGVKQASRAAERMEYPHWDQKWAAGITEEKAGPTSGAVADAASV